MVIKLYRKIKSLPETIIAVSIWKNERFPNKLFWEDEQGKEYSVDYKLIKNIFNK